MIVTRHRSGALLIPVLIVMFSYSPARASCAGPPIGTTPSPPTGPIFIGTLLSEVGEGTAGTLFEFDVESVKRGEVPERVVVDIMVDRVHRGLDGRTVAVEASSNSIGPPPRVGAKYRVEAYRGSPGGRPQLFINGCGGRLQRLAARQGFWTEWGATAISAAVSAVLLGIALIRRRKLTGSLEMR